MEFPHAHDAYRYIFEITNFVLIFCTEIFKIDFYINLNAILNEKRNFSKKSQNRNMLARRSLILQNCSIFSYAKFISLCRLAWPCVSIVCRIIGPIINKYICSTGDDQTRRPYRGSTWCHLERGQ